MGLTPLFTSTYQQEPSGAHGGIERASLGSDQSPYWKKELLVANVVLESAFNHTELTRMLSEANGTPCM